MRTAPVDLSVAVTLTRRSPEVGQRLPGGETRNVTGVNDAFSIQSDDKAPCSPVAIDPSVLNLMSPDCEVMTFTLSPVDKFVVTTTKALNETASDAFGGSVPEHPAG